MVSWVPFSEAVEERGEKYCNLGAVGLRNEKYRRSLRLLVSVFVLALFSVMVMVVMVFLVVCVFCQIRSMMVVLFFSILVEQLWPMSRFFLSMFVTSV